MGPGDWGHLDGSDAPVDPGFDFSVYDDAFLSAERTVQRQVASGEPPPVALGPDDLHAMIEALRAESEGRDAAP